MSKEVIQKIDRWKKEVKNPLNDDKTKGAFLKKLLSVCEYIHDMEHSLPINVTIKTKGGMVYSVEKPKGIKVTVKDFDITDDEYPAIVDGKEYHITEW